MVEGLPRVGLMGMIAIVHTINLLGMEYNGEKVSVEADA